MFLKQNPSSLFYLLCLTTTDMFIKQQCSHCWTSISINICFGFLGYDCAQFHYTTKLYSFFSSFLCNATTLKLMAINEMDLSLHAPQEQQRLLNCHCIYISKCTTSQNLQSEWATAWVLEFIFDTVRAIPLTDCAVLYISARCPSGIG